MANLFEGLTPDEESFLEIIIMLEAGALQGLGKLKNPVEGKTKLNLQQARRSINAVEMLYRRFSDRLTEREKEFVERVLSELRLLFIKVSEGERRS
ncbi:DUF1844 domain-containing protein [bacterium]|nr:DUF1844 domain-containing protein [bacterium]